MDCASTNKRVWAGSGPGALHLKTSSHVLKLHAPQAENSTVTTGQRGAKNKSQRLLSAPIKKRKTCVRPTEVWLF